MTSQLKRGSESALNNASSFLSQGKGKKRERVDQGSEPVKRERSGKTDNEDSGHGKPEFDLKSEIAKITEKGGLEDSEGFERLVQLMMTERNVKKIDLVSRSLLACVIAATAKFELHSLLVQCRVLPVFDVWLQEVHKGRNGDSSCTKDDRSVDDFLLTVLSALDKLPVNLTGLQMCNIGKSVNQLRSHKNIEIQKKARILVDTWKRRVEAEMDARSSSSLAVTLSAKHRLSEVSDSGSKHCASPEVALKSSVTHLSASRSGSLKRAQGDISTKSASPLPGPMKAVSLPASASTNAKDGEAQNAIVVDTPDPQTTTMDEKSSSSSQSHNNSQSCSTDRVKSREVSRKEDARNSTAGSGTVTKVSGSSSRHRQSINGFSGPLGFQREIISSKNSSFHRTPASGKISQSGITYEKAANSLRAEGTNRHKFVVKVSKHGRSPPQSTSGGSPDGHSAMNRASPVLSEKHEQLDPNIKDKSDTYQENVITESWQSNDHKHVVAGCDGGDGSAAAVPDEVNCQTGEDAKKSNDVTKTAFSSSGKEHKSEKLREASFSSMNALIESCVKYCEADACMLPEDDAGMNLLASVVVEEIAKSDVALPTDSPQRNTPVVGNSSTCHDTVLDPVQFVDDADEHLKQGVIGNSCPEHIESKTASSQKKSGELNEHLTSSNMGLPDTADQFLENCKLKENMTVALVNLPSVSIIENKAVGVDDDTGLDTEQKGDISLVNEVDLNTVLEVEEEVVDGSSTVLSEIDVEHKKNVAGSFDIRSVSSQKAAADTGHSTKGTDKEALPLSSKDIILENVDEKVEKGVETDAHCHASPSEKHKPCGETVTTQKGEHLREILEGNKGCEPEAPSPCKASTTVMETELPLRPRGSKSTDAEADESEEHASTNTDPPATGSVDTDVKIEFDLNEGFNVHEGKFGEMKNLTIPGCSAPVQLIIPLPFPVSSVSSGLPTPIGAAFAAKGLSVPPDDLLRIKGAVGWQESAATSAIRSDEPIMTLDIPVGSSETSSPDATFGKQSRLPLDIDLNIPDEGVLEDLAPRSSTHGEDCTLDLPNTHNLKCGLMVSAPICTSGGLDLDLNKVDEPDNMPNHTIGNNHRLEIFMQPVSSSTSDVLNVESKLHRDFDLNNGPVVDEVSAEPSPFSQHGRSNNVPSQSPVPSLRIKNTEITNLSSWFPMGNTHSGFTVLPILTGREQPFPIVAAGGPQRVLGPTTVAVPFNTDVYSGSVLSSSPAVAFPATLFPFGTTFPLPSTSFSGGSTAYVDSSPSGRLCFPTVHSQLLGPGSAAPSHYPRPYIVNLPDGSSSSGAESGMKWGRQGLDLNSGPGGSNIEGRGETTPLVPRQLTGFSSVPLTEEQARMYLAPGGILKRKESDGGWDGHKQSSWQ